MLGRMYWDGEGGAVNASEAVKLWREGADLNDALSNERLGWVHELGRDGSAKDLGTALYYYGIAAELYKSSGKTDLLGSVLERRGSLARILPPERWRRSGRI